MMRWWTITGLCAALGCSGAQEDDIGSVQQAVFCSRDPLPSPSEGQSWHWGGGADYPDAVRPNWPSCDGAIYERPGGGWPETAQELRDALATLAAQPEYPQRVIFLEGTTTIEIDPDFGGPLVIPANTWLAGTRGRRVNNSFDVLVPSKGALITSTRRNTGQPLIKVVGDNVRITGLRIWGPEPEQCPWEWGDLEHPEEPKACTYLQPCSEVCIMDNYPEDDLPNTCLVDDPEGGLETGKCITDGKCFDNLGMERFDCTANMDSCADYYVEENVGCANDVVENNCTYCTNPTVGIEVDLPIPDSEPPEGESVDNFEVDNCDISGFGFSGVAVERALAASIHHNYIHNIQRPGLGYPVVVGIRDADPELDGYPPASAFIRHNRFQNFRHAVASTGGSAHDYTADNNLALEKTIGRVFDVHVVRVGGHDIPTNDAGGTTIVRNNVILQDDYRSFHLKGIPAVGAYFYSNCTVRSEQPIVGGDEVPVSCGPNPWPEGDVPPDEGPEAVCQSGGFSTRVHIGESTTGASAPNTYDWDPNEVPNECASPRWCFSSRGIRPYEYLNISHHGIDELRYGDFDGNGKTDILHIEADGTWKVSYDGVGLWHIVFEDTQVTNPADLMLGDFNGDGRTDVFRRKLVVFPSTWSWQYIPGEPEPPGNDVWTSGPDAWLPLMENAGSMPVSELAVGRFDTENPEDLTDDIFNANGTVWQYRKDGSGDWHNLRNTTTPMANLALGNFNLDAISDVFWADGNAWRYYPGGTGSPVMLDNDNDIPVYKLKFGDLGGNSRTDVFYANGLRWRYKLAGIGEWIELALAAENYDEVVLGYFDDDPPLDVFFPDCH